MSNHIHLLWKTVAMNGKETAQGSFLKYTAHEFRKNLLKDNLLASFRVNAANKLHEFWQRDSLAIPIINKEMGYQKLEYIHNNPLQEKWKLVTEPSDYMYSSAKFYETGISNFDFLVDIRGYWG